MSTDHPDLHKLAQIREEQARNGSMDPEDPYFSELLRSVVDEASLLETLSPVMMDCFKSLTATPLTPEAFFSIIAALCTDAFVLGVLFERNGGTTHG